MKQSLLLALPTGHSRRSSLRRGAWIETAPGSLTSHGLMVAPLSGGGRGLKLLSGCFVSECAASRSSLRRGAWIETPLLSHLLSLVTRRSSLRRGAWIETRRSQRLRTRNHVAPLSGGGRGLKLGGTGGLTKELQVAPLSGGGRGLKLGWLSEGAACCVSLLSPEGGVD